MSNFSVFTLSLTELATINVCTLPKRKRRKKSCFTYRRKKKSRSTCRQKRDVKPVLNPTTDSGFVLDEHDSLLLPEDMMAGSVVLDEPDCLLLTEDMMAELVKDLENTGLCVSEENGETYCGTHYSCLRMYDDST